MFLFNKKFFLIISINEKLKSNVSDGPLKIAFLSWPSLYNRLETIFEWMEYPCAFGCARVWSYTRKPVERAKR